MGIPTAISYDVVKCGNSYGVIYEMLDAKTEAQIFEEDPSQIPELTRKSAELLKELHQIVPGPDAGLPKFKQHLFNWLDLLSGYLTAQEIEKIKNFIKNIPERDTFLHGDYHAKNLILRNGEIQLIDMGSASIGHPIFDISACMTIYLIMPATSDKAMNYQTRHRILGFGLEHAQQVWDIMCGTYFGLSSHEEIEAMTKKLMPYCFLFAVYKITYVHGTEGENFSIFLEKLFRENLLPAIDTAEHLDF